MKNTNDLVKQRAIKKVFVTGASGMLGTTLHDVFKSDKRSIVSTDLNPLDPWTLQLDVRNKRKVKELIRSTKPDYVLNLAALTDVEYCELHKTESFDTNAQGAVNVARVCKEFDIPLVHISTAGVFNGKKNSPYTEEDIPKPINVYGMSKFEAEKEIPKILDNYFIFRAGWMMGSGDRDKKFVRKVLRLIETGHNTLYGLTDMYGCPTYTKDFAKGILHMITNNHNYGLYHMVSEGNCSRYDVSVSILKVLKLNHIKLIPVTGDYFKETFFAPRPKNETMIDKKLIDNNIRITRPWNEGLEDYLTTHPFFKKIVELLLTEI